MPDFCAAYGCSNERSTQTKSRGITFHRFPKDSTRKKEWELAVRRKGFVASGRTLLCSEHFRAEDFDTTGQTVRLREGVKPSIFNFPSRSQKQRPSRTTQTSRKAEERLPADMPQLSREADPQSNVQRPSRTTQTSRKAEERLPVDVPQHSHGADPQSNVDHNYALPASPAALKARLGEALARVESLKRRERNSMIRERRAKKNLLALLEDLKEKNLINEELRDRLTNHNREFCIACVKKRKKKKVNKE